MLDGKVRALCAQIALELDPAKAEALSAKLKRALNGECETPKAEQESKLPNRSRSKPEVTA